MKQIVIQGGNKLSGTIKIGGAKNSAVALIPASILADDVVKIDNIPKIAIYFGVTADYLLGLENRKFIEVSNLTEKQISHIQLIIDDIKK